ncbi:MAG TPA: LamG-like jellyroll fold domain-containing protein, partial [Candidatus Sulfotelmatobacter sp.]|nr:LamG-like jellyroll fold domain-containing protein [Candidatus Sulfotelmatobacter sp.]
MRSASGLAGPVLWLVLLLVVMGAACQAALIDAWQAGSLTALDDGDAVGSWASASNRVAVAVVGNEPVLAKNATPSGAPAVQFAADRLTAGSSPVAGLTAFSMAVVFKADQLGVDEGSGWSTKSGIVDANQAAITNDWGFAIRETGFICFGTSRAGGSDQTVYLDNQPTYPSVVDGQYHVVVCTWGGGSQTIYLDKLPAKTQTGVPTTARDNAGMSFGAIHSGETTRRFVGALAEVQFYNTALTGTEATELIAQLADRYLTNHLPVVLSFKADTNMVYAGSPVTLSWAVSNATLVTIDNGVGTFYPATSSVQVLPAVTTTYTLTASNGAGIGTAQVLVTVDPGIPSSVPQMVSVVKNTPCNLTLTGHDPQNASLTFAIVQWPQHGGLSGTPPNVVYTPQTNYVGADFFTFKGNDGTNDSPPATVQLYVDEVAVAPHGIFLSAEELDATATPGTFLASLRAVDANRFDTHTFALATGVGATHNNLFTLNGNRLLAGAGFPTTPGTNLSIRVRAT